MTPPPSPAIRITEVGPRDGLQNEPETIPTAVKIAFVNALADAGHTDIEVSSFVSPKWVPQLADAADVFAALKPREGVTWSALVPNLKGMERALACGVRRVAVFTAATETFNRRNINASIDESLERFVPVLALARREGVPVRGYVSTAFGCPYEGEVEPAAAAQVGLRLLEMGCEEISMGDTIGVAGPARVEDGLEALEDAGIEPAQVALHFHDTRGQALANVVTSLAAGYLSFDASSGGLGGCPYAPGAGGNLATEDLLYLLGDLRLPTPVSLCGALDAARVVEAALGRPLPGRVLRAGGALKPGSNS